MTDEIIEEKPKARPRKATKDEKPAEVATPTDNGEHKPRFDENAPSGLVGKC